ncbi:phage tail protein [Trabulsiella odontotermitis]|uniref:phage tail protein n=1 Tax=Trabulsiella odontotermitis TaxID=379893 RepID=UPI00067697A2|nr:phage tail protein [Trabulsiella odontotermitis]KNC89857.1 tail protein [Trabulsiella odontotermitis]
MLKIDSLRETLTQKSQWCRANPEKFSVYVEDANVETTGETPSFMYRYTMVLFVMNFAGDIDEFTLPILGWLWHNQPDLLLNPDKNKSIEFTAVINDDDTADLIFSMPIRERVKVALDESGVPKATHLPEPKPRIPSADGDWSSVFEDVTWKDPV